MYVPGYLETATAVSPTSPLSSRRQTAYTRSPNFIKELRSMFNGQRHVQDLITVVITSNSPLNRPVLGLFVFQRLDCIHDRCTRLRAGYGRATGARIVIRPSFWIRHNVAALRIGTPAVLPRAIRSRNRENKVVRLFGFRSDYRAITVVKFDDACPCFSHGQPGPSGNLTYVSAPDNSRAVDRIQ